MARRKAGGELVTAEAPAAAPESEASVDAQILQFSADAQIDITDLQKEFRVFPSTLFAYNEAKALIKIKSGETKVTEKHADALVMIDPVVKAAFLHMLDMKRNLETFKNYVESLRAKKDMLIQLGADARKE